MLLLALSVMPLLVGIVKENIMKRYIDNDKYSDTMRWKMRGSNSLSKIIDDLLWASDSDWILDDGDNVILLYNTGMRDGYAATSKDLGGYTLGMLKKLIDKTDVVSSYYGKDGHLGLKLNRDALKRRMRGSVLDDMNRRMGYHDYRPGYDNWDKYVADMNKLDLL